MLGIRSLGIRILLARILLSALLLGGAASSAASQAYPSKPIKLIVPFPPGGPIDVMGRLIAQRLAPAFGQFVIENRPGAGGTLASRSVATAEPDGYTLMIATSTTMGVSPNLYKIDYEPVKSFAPIAFLSTSPFVLVVKPSLPVHSTQELIAYAKANPGKLNFGFPTGTLPQLTGELFKLRAGLSIQSIPYKGAANVITDLLAGQIDMTFEPTQVLVSHISDAKVRPLAITSAKRNPQLPEIPTVAESGVPGFESMSWTGIVAPAGTPEPILKRLSDTINAELQTPEMKAHLQRLGVESQPGTPASFQAFIDAEVPKWAEVIKSSGMKLE
jgi:tripartite-type tricarboxylate transporter receptor subunit TctC